jgi:hypothetical protein
MDWLEQELKSALARKDPPPGFAERVGEAIDRASPGAASKAGPIASRRVIAWPSRVAQRWLAAAAAAVILMIGGGVGYRWHRGIVAKRQVMQAFLIAGGQLNHLHAHLKEVSQ